MKRISSIIITIIVLVFLIIPNELKADITEIKNKLPQMLGANNWGTEFWFTIPPNFEDESGAYQNIIRIFVTSPYETNVRLEIKSNNYAKEKRTIPNGVIEFQIFPFEGQPYLKSAYQNCIPEAVYPDKGIHISADQPIVVYVVVKYHATSDGYIAIPVSSLGKEYICASYPDMTLMFPGYTLPSLCGIVAAFDDTEVTFKLGGNIYTKTPSGMKPGDSATKTLNKGDVWMFSSEGPEADLSGSKITANKPIAVVSGNQCTNIPTTNSWCDYTVEMDLPTYTWGLVYHIPKVPKRKYPSIVRIYAKEPNTTIYRDGKQFGFIPESGGKIADAYIETRMVSGEPRSCVFSGDKPIGVTLYNCGIVEDSNASLNSDPFVMAINPDEQLQKEITFCTPGINGQGFPENYVNIVFQTNSNNMMPDDLEFGEVIDSIVTWVKVKDKFGDTFESFSYDVNNTKYGVKTLDSLGEGVFKIRANNPFAAYSFGYSYCDSYGYPTGETLSDLDKIDTLAPEPNFIMNMDGSVNNGYVADKPDDPNICSNLSLILFNSDYSYNYKFENDEFIPGDDKETSWKLRVIDSTKDAQAFITFCDRNGNDTIINIFYKTNYTSVNKGGIEGFNLKDIYPNPAKKPELKVEFSLGNDCQAELVIVNTLGQIISTPLKEFLSSGEYTRRISINDLVPGSYAFVLTAGKYKFEKKFVIIE